MSSQQGSTDYPWLAVPTTTDPLTGADAQSLQVDPYSSRIGGRVTWLRTPPPTTISTVAASGGTKAASSAAMTTHSLLRCRSCQGPMTPLLQFHAPLSCFDRVLYVLACEACGKKVPSSFNDGPAGSVFDRRRPHRAHEDDAAMAAMEPQPSLTSLSVVVLRCQVYNPDYDVEAVRAAEAADAASKPKEANLFEEEDDWGDSDDTKATSTPAPPPPPTVPSAPAPHVASLFDPQVTTEATAMDTTLPSSIIKPVYPIEAYEDVEEVPLLEEETDFLERMGIVQTSSNNRNTAGPSSVLPVDVLDNASEGEDEDDEETQGRWEERFVSVLSRYPKQVIRWQPGGRPLWIHMSAALKVSAGAVLASSTNHVGGVSSSSSSGGSSGLRAWRFDPSVIPPCPLCHAPRQFECQVVSPLIYFLTKHLAAASSAGAATASGGGRKGGGATSVEDQHGVHFGNIVIFTCSQHCYKEHDPAYVEEFVLVEEEF